jgi:Arc/MetJ family transcription regulator
MRTNIILNDELVADAMKVSGERTKTAAIHRALELLVRQARLRELRSARGTLRWDGDLNAMRERTAPYAEPARRHKRTR